MTEQHETPQENAKTSSTLDCFGMLGGQKKGEGTRSRWLSGIVFGALFLWAGAVWLADAGGIIDGLAARTPLHVDGWTVFFLGAGTILLVEIALRLFLPEFGKPEAVTFVGLIVFFGIALAGWEVFWPIALLAVGASILLKVVVHKHRTTDACPIT